MHQPSPGASLSPTPNRTPRSSKTNVFAPHSSANTPTLRSARASRESIKSSGAESEGEVRELLAPLHLRLAVQPEGCAPSRPASLCFRATLELVGTTQTSGSASATASRQASRSRPYLAYIPPLSPLYLAYISPRLYLFSSRQRLTTGLEQGPG